MANNIHPFEDVSIEDVLYRFNVALVYMGRTMKTIGLDNPIYWVSKEEIGKGLTIKTLYVGHEKKESLKVLIYGEESGDNND